MIDGTIDIIATDHAPHPIESKDCEWNAAAFGMLGLETAASIAQDVLIESGKSSWTRLAEVLSSAPARIGGDDNQGQMIQTGSVANIVLIDPKARRKVVADSASKSKNSPYVGLELPGRVVHTIFKGYFTVRDSRNSLRGGVTNGEIRYGSSEPLYYSLVFSCLAARAWQKRKQDQTAKFEAPLEALEYFGELIAQSSGFYVATTYAENHLERISAYGLGARGVCQILVFGEGVLIVRNGERPLAIAKNALGDISANQVAIDKAVEANGTHVNHLESEIQFH